MIFKSGYIKDMNIKVCKMTENLWLRCDFYFFVLKCSPALDMIIDNGLVVIEINKKGGYIQLGLLCCVGLKIMGGPNCRSEEGAEVTGTGK